MNNYKNRKGPWLQLSSGKRFYPLDFRIEDINIHDWALGLSRESRFAGQYKIEVPFYSVAQHSVIGSYLIQEKFTKTFLLHDLSEGVLKDIPKPFKNLLPEYEKIETNCMKILSEKFNIEFPFPKEVKKTDMRMLYTEKRDIMNEKIWDEYYPPFNYKINEFWSPKEAYKKFLGRFYELIGK